MDYTEFVQLMGQANRLLSDNKYKEAGEIFYTLLMSDISDADKAGLCVKMAIIQDRIGSSDEALTWYDKGIGYEQPFCRFEVIMQKSHYLSDLGRAGEAVPMLEELVKQPYVREAEKDTLRKEIRVLLSRAIGQWK